MPLTRDFKETIRDRVQRDPRFRKELLREGLEAMLSGDITVAKTILRDYINGRFHRSLRGYSYSVEKPDAHVRPQWQPARGELLWNREFPSAARRCAPSTLRREPHESLQGASPP